MERIKQQFSKIFRGSPASRTSVADRRIWGRERRKREILPKPWEGTEFLPLEGDDLEEVAVVAQALDNQWVSRKHLKDMLQRSRESSRLLGLKDIEAERASVSRAEYIRSLITTEQVVINRAYLYNTDIVRQDYIQSGASRGAFADLLNSGVIVPCLFKEQAPIQRPKSFDKDESGFSKDEAAFNKWVQICQETRPHCVRLSWNDQGNEAKTNDIAARFHAWARTLDLVATKGNFDQFISDLGIRAEDKDKFLNHLNDIARWSVDTSEVSREKLYQRFVVADKTEPKDGIYECDPKKKPFSGQIKQLADLSYNTNLPDALGRYALTPIDSLPRTALQELTVKLSERSNFISSKELMGLLQREWFATLSTAGGEFLSSLNLLTLSDVKAIRATDQWAAYMEELKGLLANPLELHIRGRGIYKQYIDLAKVFARFTAKEDSRRLERWQPALTLVLTIGPALVQAAWNPLASNFLGQVEYNMIGNVTQNVAGVAARLIIGGVAGLRAQAQLETGVDFMRAQIVDAQALWETLRGELDIKRQAGKAGGFTAMSPDIYDPNINYSEDM